MGKKRSVLIIEDSMVNVKLLTGILSENCNVHIALNGREGLEAALAYRPDVIVLDIVMPQMDGYETITALKNDSRLKNIPVIFITGLTKTEDEEKALALGGADFITKPFNPAIVKLRVNNQIRILDYIDKIEHMSMFDGLTDMPNRRCFDDRLSMEWGRAKRENESLSIFIIDVDHFKRYNDTFGHLNGDVALKTIANVIDKTLSRPGDFAARWGGEEFIVLLPNTDSTGAVNIAEQIRVNVENTTITLRGGEVTKATVSIGVNTLFPATAGSSLDDFIQRADEALYTAKTSGRNRVCYEI
ncbi:MAG: diguanylate cyclase [Defluviitaleaceae bacterium]|nr:diguanylate cyclase [Defluviitaleaceae bacterium]